MKNSTITNNDIKVLGRVVAITAENKLAEAEQVYDSAFNYSRAEVIDDYSSADGLNQHTINQLFKSKLIALDNSGLVQNGDELVIQKPVKFSNGIEVDGPSTFKEDVEIAHPNNLIVHGFIVADRDITCNNLTARANVNAKNAIIEDTTKTKHLIADDILSNGNVTIGKDLKVVGNVEIDGTLTVGGKNITGGNSTDDEQVQDCCDDLKKQLDALEKRVKALEDKINAGGGGGEVNPPEPTEQTVQVNTFEHTTAEPVSATVGEPTTITVNPEEGYKIDQITKVENGGENVPSAAIVKNDDGSYTITIDEVKGEIKITGVASKVEEADQSKFSSSTEDLEWDWDDESAKSVQISSSEHWTAEFDITQGGNTEHFTIDSNEADGDGTIDIYPISKNITENYIYAYIKVVSDSGKTINITLTHNKADVGIWPIAIPRGRDYDLLDDVSFDPLMTSGSTAKNSADYGGSVYDGLALQFISKELVDGQLVSAPITVTPIESTYFTISDPQLIDDVNHIYEINVLPIMPTSESDLDAKLTKLIISNGTHTYPFESSSAAQVGKNYPIYAAAGNKTVTSNSQSVKLTQDKLLIGGGNSYDGISGMSPNIPNFANDKLVYNNGLYITCESSQDWATVEFENSQYGTMNGDCSVSVQAYDGVNSTSRKTTIIYKLYSAQGQLLHSWEFGQIEQQP